MPGPCLRIFVPTFRRPHVPPGGGKSLAHWLTHSPSLGFLSDAANVSPEVPALTAYAFHQRVAGRLEPMTDFEIHHWLRHGTGPDAHRWNASPKCWSDDRHDGRVSRRGCEGSIALGDTVPLVRHFVSALSPAATQTHAAQVADRRLCGRDQSRRPSRLLPSQLALDPDDFVRRFARTNCSSFAAKTRTSGVRSTWCWWSIRAC